MVLEDLAAHFKMKAQDTIDRVTELLDQGHITGVMDDRGKFIYISQVSLLNYFKWGKELALNSLPMLHINVFLSYFF